MRDPFLELEPPEVLRSLVALLRSPSGRRLRVALPCDPLGWLAGEADIDPATEQPGFPMELVPFAVSGDVSFGLLVHDAALAPVAASWSPWDEEACWLGRDAGHALANLVLAGRGEAALHAAADRDLLDEIAAAGEALLAALGLEEPHEDEFLDDGLRSTRACTPPVPPGWRFEECNDGVGVLAPAAAFAPEGADLDPAEVFDLSAELALADALLADGWPASALAVARNTLHFVRHEAGRQDAAGRMVSAYEALGREAHARRLRRCLPAWG